jgi:hypothetical protein
MTITVQTVEIAGDWNALGHIGTWLRVSSQPKGAISFQPSAISSANRISDFRLTADT